MKVFDIDKFKKELGEFLKEYAKQGNIRKFTVSFNQFEIFTQLQKRVVDERMVTLTFDDFTN